MVFWILKQDEKCRGACLSSKYKADCAKCTNENARDDFHTCSGLKGADPELGGGDGGSDAPKEGQVNVGAVSGGIIGALILLSGVVVAGRKYREKMLNNDALTKEMGLSIFKGGHAPHEDAAQKQGAVEDAEQGSAVAGIAAAGAVGAVATKRDTVDVHGLYVRTRFSFHGTEADELDVQAGVTLKAVEKNDNWYVCQDERTGSYGLIPINYVSSL